MKYYHKGHKRSQKALLVKLFLAQTFIQKAMTAGIKILIIKEDTNVS